MTKSKTFFGKNEREALETLGLSEAELSVYLAALELGQANIQDISSKSGVKRTSIYNFIDTLKDKQLLSEVRKGKRRVYSPASPHRLLQLQKSRVALLEQIIPELLAINNVAQNKPRVSFYEGVEGIKEIYNMTLRDKQTIYALEDLDRTHDALGSFFKSYPEERAAKKIPARCIDRDTPFAREFTAKNNERLARESRFISSDEFGTEINIFGNKVAFFSYHKNSPFGVVVDDIGIATALKVIWRELWDRLGPMKPTNS